MSKVEGYNLQVPDAARALETYSTALGQEGASQLWAEACSICGVDHQDPDLDNLEKVYHHLATLPGVEGVFGMSLKMRLKAYRNLLRVRSKTA